MSFVKVIGHLIKKKKKDHVKAEVIEVVWYMHSTERAISGTELRVWERHYRPSVPSQKVSVVFHFGVTKPLALIP